MADKITVIKRTIKLPENNPTLNVVQGLCCSPVDKFLLFYNHIIIIIVSYLMVELLTSSLPFDDHHPPTLP